MYGFLFTFEGHGGSTVLLAQFDHILTLELVCLDCGHSLKHLLFGVHVGTHHPCAAQHSEVDGFGLGISLERTGQTVASCAAVHQILIRIETDERHIIALRSVQSLVVDFGDVPFSGQSLNRCHLAACATRSQ